MPCAYLTSLNSVSSTNRRMAVHIYYITTLWEVKCISYCVLVTHKLANKVLDFYAYQISGIRLKLAGASASDKFLYSNSIPSVLNCFRSATLAEVNKLNFYSPNTGSLSFAIFYFSSERLLWCPVSIITSTVNLSLHEVTFLSTYAHAIVRPLLKKPYLVPVATSLSTAPSQL